MHLVERVFQLELPLKKNRTTFPDRLGNRRKGGLDFSYFPHASIQSVSARVYFNVQFYTK
jgi:hypothetical protein